jgi:hypothetical protein
LDSTADVLGIAVDLHLLHAVPRQKFGEGKIRSQQKEQIGVVNSAVGSAVAEKSSHADGVQIVVLQPLLTAKGIADGGLQAGREGDDFVASLPAAVASEDGNVFCVFDHADKLFEIGIRGAKNRLGGND